MIINNNIFFNKWIDYKYSINIDSQLLNRELFINIYEEFIKEINPNIVDNQCILVNLKFEILEHYDVSNSDTYDERMDIENTKHRSISEIQRITNKDYTKLQELLLLFWDLKKNNYTTFIIKNIVFVVKYLPFGLVSPTGELITTQLSYDDEMIEVENYKYKGYNLLQTMDITLWGASQFNKDYSYVEVISPNTSNLSNLSLIYKVKINDNSLEVDA